MSKVFEQIDITKVTDQNGVAKIYQYAGVYEKKVRSGQKKEAEAFLEKLVTEVKKKYPKAIRAKRVRTPKVRQNLKAIQKAGQDLRLQKSSRAGEILAKANTAKTRELNREIAMDRLKRKGFAGICGYGSNDVML